jgi:Gram-negative bacterial TonB protein C-terminal
MLPTEPKSKLTVSQGDNPMFKSAHTATAKNPMLQFANKAGNLIIQHSFWLLLAGSVGIHTVFALVTPNPIKKEELREVVVSTLPVVKLPPRSLPTNTRPNIFDNLFSKSAPKTTSSQNTFPDTSSSSSLTILDPDSLSSTDGLPPVTDFSSSDTPFPDDKNNDAPQFVKPQTPDSKTTKEETSQRFTQSGKIDNTNPVKPTDNIKPEFKNGNPRKDGTSPNKNNGNNKAPDKIATNQQADNGDRREKSIDNATKVYITNPKILDLTSRKLLKNTEIAPSEALLSDLDSSRREKGVEWIPPKRANTSGKSGTVTFMWLVDPNGKIEEDTVILVLSGISELDDIAREAAKGYKFKPIEDPASGVYRLVTAKYKFS